MNLLAMKSADAREPLATVVGFTFSKIPFILFSSSSTVFVIPVIISNGAPFLPMKNKEGNGTNLSEI